MRLKMKQLQNAVKKTVNENKATVVLRNEIARVFGPIIDTNQHIIDLARAVNERVSVLNNTGRSYGLVKPSALLNLMRHNSSDVRKMVALLIPESFLHQMSQDKSHIVRETVARRAPLKVVKEIVRSNPLDYGVIDTYRDRLLEAKEALSVSSDDAYIPTGDSIKMLDIPDLTDEWYRDRAIDMIDMYGKGPEFGWEEKAVSALCKHTKAISGVEIDYDKLLNTVFDVIEERDDQIVNLKEISARLRYEDEIESLNETAIMPALPEEVYDPVVELYESRDLSDKTYIEKFNNLFNVKVSHLPTHLKRQRILERLDTKMLVPQSARMPFNDSVNLEHESALDRYVDAWNTVNRRQNLMINWAHDTSVGSRVHFFVSER